MAERKEEGLGGAILILVALIVFALFLIWFGLFAAKMIYRYSRSGLAAISFFLWHLGFLYSAVALSEGEGENARNGWEVLKTDYLDGFSPFAVYAIVFALVAAFTSFRYSKLSDSDREAINNELQQEQARSSRLGTIGKLLVLGGSGVLGYKAGRAAGKSLL